MRIKLVAGIQLINIGLSFYTEDYPSAAFWFSVLLVVLCFGIIEAINDLKE